jgi:hypothetical protein
MMPVRQNFPAPPPIDVRQVLQAQLPRLAPQLKAGARIAVGVGSRGISNLQPVVAGVVDFLKAAGTKPFIVPAMGSHGGATPQGQLELLSEYGITEAALGVPIEAAMEAKVIGTTPDQVDVFFSEAAGAADGVIVINRVKPHTDFQSEVIGSGLLKMLVIGLGKRLGAANYHRASSRFGYEHVLRTSARVTLQAAPILAGVAIVENQFHDTARVEVVPAANLEHREVELFQEARALMPRLPFDDIDLLIVDQLGKNISGAGMDPNVIGRSLHGYSASLGERSNRPVVRRLFVRDLTPESHGNAVGVGLADFTSRRLVDKIDHQVTYLNALTALSLQSVKIPVYFDTDRESVGRALESLAMDDTRRATVVRIQNTLSLETVEIAETLAERLPESPALSSTGPLRNMSFDDHGNLATLGQA